MTAGLTGCLKVPSAFVDSQLTAAAPCSKEQMNFDVVCRWEQIETERRMTVQRSFRSSSHALPPTDLVTIAQSSRFGTCRSEEDTIGCMVSRGLQLKADTSLSRQFVVPSVSVDVVLPPRVGFGKTMKSLGANDAIIRFDGTADAYQVFVLFRGTVTQVDLGRSRRVIDAKVLGIVQLMQDIPSNPALLADSAWRDDAAWLYESLLLPLEQMIDGEVNLIIIPDGILGWLPFEMLIRDASIEKDGALRSEYAFERFNLSYSISVAQALSAGHRRQKLAPSVLVVGNAANRALESVGLFQPLPDAEREARVMGEIAPDATVLLNEAATKTAVLASLGSADVVHIAAHGKSLPNVNSSFLVLSDADGGDGLLTQGEILQQRLSASLVMLSACETGVAVTGDDSAGLASLATSFLLAGSDAVVASMWQVHSKATSLFMAEFYQGYGRQSVSKSLTGARRMLLESDEYGHPYFWASFVHFGRAL